MLYDLVADPGTLAPSELLARYEAELRAVLDDVGTERAVTESGVDRETVEALAAGESVPVTLEEAASLLALGPDVRDADVIADMAREELLLGMSTAVLDVDAIASGLHGEMEPREIQRKVEGRSPMTLAEFATLQQFIEGRKR